MQTQGNTSRQNGLAKMKAFAARQPTLTLCGSLAMLDKGKLSEEERLARAVIMDTLTERHPEAEAAAEAWSEDLSTPTAGVGGLADVIIKASQQAMAGAR
jgi:hypothetical protein